MLMGKNIATVPKPRMISGQNRSLSLVWGFSWASIKSDVITIAEPAATSTRGSKCFKRRAITGIAAFS